ncbi:maturase, partial [Escherichia coli]
LIDGNYQPRAIRRMDIPKPDGGVRTSGIPTVVDRLIQQAVQQAQRYIRGGKRWVVDMDLEKFFDRVDHRLLMTRLARTIKDRRVL